MTQKTYEPISDWIHTKILVYKYNTCINVLVFNKIKFSYINLLND
jgi:hypothetical protein